MGGCFSLIISFLHSLSAKLFSIYVHYIFVHLFQINKHTMMMSGFAVVFLTLVATTLGSTCPFSVTQECSCKQPSQSLVNVHCSFPRQDNLSQTLIQNTNASRPIKIHVLNITRSNLTSLPSDFLDGVETIDRVDFSHNMFTDIPQCLQTVKNISAIDISYNQIRSVNLSELHTQGLDISQNAVSEIHLCDALTKQMAFLKASHNNIAEIPQNLWMVAESLDISFNLISHLPNAASSSTKYFYLRGNSIQSIPNNWFLGFKDLTVLDVSQNQLKSLTNKTFNGLSALQNLQLSQNQLSGLSYGIFQHMFLLRNLSLNENKIHELGKSTFMGLEESLQELRISNNELVTIASDTFAILQGLHRLDLSDNVKIQSVEHINFPPHLTVLNLSNCNLQQIHDCKFFESYDLQHLDLSSNNLTCNCHLSWLYLRFESRQTLSNQWTCHELDAIQPVQGNLSQCHGESFSEHHCRTSASQALDPEDINITVVVSADNNGLLTTWEIEPYNAMELIGGFKVSYTSEDESLKSPVLDKTKRLFVFDRDEENGDYTVCVYLMETSTTTTLKTSCHSVVKENYQIIVGVLAGVVFLLPCVAAMMYIFLKDKRMMYDPVNTQADYCCDEHKEKNMPEKNDVHDQMEKSVGHNGNVPSRKPGVQVNMVSEVPVAKRPHNVETPLDVKRLEDVKTSLPARGSDLATVNRGYVCDCEVSCQDNETGYVVDENGHIKTVTKL